MCASYCCPAISDVFLQYILVFLHCVISSDKHYSYHIISLSSFPQVTRKCSGCCTGRNGSCSGCCTGRNGSCSRCCTGRNGSCSVCCAGRNGSSSGLDMSRFQNSDPNSKNNPQKYNFQITPLTGRMRMLREKRSTHSALRLTVSNPPPLVCPAWC